MAVKAVHVQVGYLMALAICSCIFIYEFIRLKMSHSR